jgi:transposase
MALRIQLSDNEKMLVQRNRLKHEKVVVRRKMDVLWLLHHGHTRAEAAVITGVARGTVQRYVADYRNGGLEALFRSERTVPVSEMEDHREILLASFRETPLRSVAEAAERIERLTGLRRGPSQVRQFLKRHGLRWQRLAAIPVPPKKVWTSMWRNSSDFTRNS